MNKILELKGTFNHAPNPSRPGPTALPARSSVTVSDIYRLTQSLEKVHRYWKEIHSPFKPLVSIYYKDIVAKSNRMGKILTNGSESPNRTIVGAKFTESIPPKHIITHCVNIHAIEQGLGKLLKVSQLLAEEFNNTITAEEINILNNNEQKLKRKLSREEFSWKTQKERAITAQGLSKSAFCQILKDAWYLDSFNVEERNIPISGSQIITLYDTGINREEILKNLGLQQEPIRILDDLTWMVTPEQYHKIISKAPYLVAMAVSDFGRIDARSLDGIKSLSSEFSIPEPTNEPVIGVIDTLFDQSSYFSSWVEYHCMISPDLIEDEDYAHGTAVSSILVDGPTLNEHLDDGCGRFRVRHFGVAKHTRNSSAYLMKVIRSIVETNRDIKVWNISLGSPLETDQN
ncbi:MAG: serine protease, partial [Sphaerochaeta sp.]|nr:serine protease [Sphaerochaeta sp.]